MLCRVRRGKQFQSLAIPALTCALPARAQLAAGGAVPEVDLIRLIAALAFCLIVGIALIYWLRRRLPLSARASDASLRLVETIRLNVKASLHVIEFEGRRWLVASDANGGVTLIAATERSAADSLKRNEAAA